MSITAFQIQWQSHQTKWSELVYWPIGQLTWNLLWMHILDKMTRNFHGNYALLVAWPPHHMQVYFLICLMPNPQIRHIEITHSRVLAANEYLTSKKTSSSNYYFLNLVKWICHCQFSRFSRSNLAYSLSPIPSRPIYLSELCCFWSCHHVGECWREAMVLLFYEAEGSSRMSTGVLPLFSLRANCQSTQWGCFLWKTWKIILQ